MGRRLRLQTFAVLLALAGIVLFFSNTLADSDFLKALNPSPRTEVASQGLTDQPSPARQTRSDSSALRSETSKAHTNLVVGASKEKVTPSVGQLRTIRIFAFGDSYTSYGSSSTVTAPTAKDSRGNRFTTSLHDCPTEDVTTCVYKWLDYVLDNHGWPSKGAGLGGELQQNEEHDAVMAWNFARGASTIDGDLIWPHYPAAKALVDQAKEFFEVMKVTGDVNTGMANKANDPHFAVGSMAPIHTAFSNDVFMVWFGINDVANTALEKDVVIDSLYRSVLQTYVRILEQFCDAGGRQFLLLNVPPLDRTPELLEASDEDIETVKLAVKLFNQLLESSVLGSAGTKNGTSFAERHLDIKVTLVDIQPIFHDWLNARIDSATCTLDEADHCAWVDKFHPAKELQTAIGQEVVKRLDKLITQA